MSYCMDCELNEDAGDMLGCARHRDGSGDFAEPTEISVCGKQYD